MGPPETLSTGGALVFVSGRDLRGGADLGILASLGARRARRRRRRARVESVSSALAVFGAPRVAAARGDAAAGARARLRGVPPGLAARALARGPRADPRRDH